MSKIIREAESQLMSVNQVLSFLDASFCRFIFRKLKGAKMFDWEKRRKLRRSGSMLYLVEYRKGNSEPLWYQIPDIKAFAPLFSPDGKQVVYNTSFMASDIFVLPVDTFEPVRVGFGSHPHWWIHPNTGEHHVVYRTENGMYTGFPTGKTMRQKLNASNLSVEKPEEICPYGFGGGISANGRYLATGYTHLIVADLQNGSYYQPLGERQLPDGQNQVCDVSLPPDDSQRVMHLRLTSTGEGRHDYFGIIDFYGRNYIRIDKPEETLEWQTPEWSTHHNFATASATRSDHTYDLYLIRLSDLEVLRLTWDGGYGHAHLWIAAKAESC